MHRFKLTELLDKLVLLVAMLLFTWVGVTAIFEVRKLDSIAGQSRPLLSELKVNAPLYEAEAPQVENVVWKPAENQSRGEDWVFDVFTPPVIYYDPNSREFAVTPPSMQPADTVDNTWATFDLELLEVRLRPYKLQLVGYAGERGSYVAYFENTSTGAIVLLREGQEDAELGVRLTSFQEQQIEISNENGTPIVQDVGVARLADYASGQQMSLTNLETKMFSDLEAKVRLLPAGNIRYVEVGSRLELESGDYLIEDLSAQPQEAMITKISKDGDRRLSRTLTPAPVSDLKPRGSRQEAAPPSPFAIRPRSPGEKPQG
ncbi:hypothetical protein IEN85_13865 [Pelagicoccus sp. NFK12]|uniref:Uncharacterized protein n=1 Tax=Pelagicoccus enzymogenes TaxID=2773457 RepID=A0A927IIB3_9BACT|nr:hypothetical protein [Pelagicoccus enzymogenes]MBD5780583.1 hypothetical protein [Pelagicoccus enzymogenes]MDQ8199016.1 hypothetical protein [Pelagicoccus enzymogenes]